MSGPMGKILDILLITPPSKDKVFQELGKSLVAIEPPVWSLLLATSPVPRMANSSEFSEARLSRNNLQLT